MTDLQQLFYDLDMVLTSRKSYHGSNDVRNYPETVDYWINERYATVYLGDGGYSRIKCDQIFTDSPIIYLSDISRQQVKDKYKTDEAKLIVKKIQKLVNEWWKFQKDQANQ